MNNQLKWVRVVEVYGEQVTPSCSTYRAAVPGGWLVAVWAAPTIDRDSVDTDRQTYGGGLTFVPDAMHAWVLEPHERQ